MWNYLAALDVREMPVSYEMPEYTVEQIMAASDDAVLRMAEEAGMDVDVNAAHCRGLFLAALGVCARCGEATEGTADGCRDYDCPLH